MCFNAQNDRRYAESAPNPEERDVVWTQKPKSVMVWAAVCATGKSPLVFIPQGVKINQQAYREMLYEHFLPWAREHFGEDWAFQQDSAPAHFARDTQAMLAEECPDFITNDQWPPSSPDLNPLDYLVWSILESKACAKPHNSIDSLKEALLKAWDEIIVEMLEKIVDDFPKRLEKCIQAQGGHFE
uniref:Tc1-like transposase DDE domain-containing protein n=1 Tax=Acrobeloides nanus TaxID=290746 RepID=A0A914DG88_9BILA